MKTFYLLFVLIFASGFSSEALYREFVFSEEISSEIIFSIKKIDDYARNCQIEIKSRLFPKFCFKTIFSLKKLGVRIDFTKNYKKLDRICSESLNQLKDIKDYLLIEKMIPFSFKCLEKFLKQKKIVFYKTQNS